MKVKIFYGHPEDVEEEFNKWAKGRALSRNIIIHTIAYPSAIESIPHLVAIAVYYPEWIEEQPEGEKP